MAIEDRSGNSYYYSKRRDGRRVISEYWGGGVMLMVAAYQSQLRLADVAKLELTKSR